MPIRTSSCNCGQLRLTYDGPDPVRISLCQCYECQRRTGTLFSVQARLPREHVTIEGEASSWDFPVPNVEAEFLSCDSGGATYYFCPRCGSTVYWDIKVAPDLVGVAVGNFTDPEFPQPMIAGFEAYGTPWALNVSALPLPHHQYDGSGQWNELNAPGLPQK